MAILLTFLFQGCKEDYELPGTGEADSRSETVVSLDVDVQSSDFRTRGSDILGNNDIKSLWVGIYDIETGNRVGGEHFKNYPSSPVTLPVLYYDQHPQVVIVGVANYENVTDWDDVAITQRLDEALTWNDFVNINVKAPLEEGVPSADKDDSFRIMMGLLSEPNSPHPFFKSDDSGKVMIDKASGYEVNLSPGSLYGSMIKEISGKKIYLKRLFSKVNVIIKSGPNASVANVSFRRGNMPKGVFLAERATYVASRTDVWNTFIANTPNFADIQMIPVNGGGQIENSDSYYSDGNNEWIPGGRDNTFSFTHYENKHWATQDAGDYNAREAYSNKERRVLRALGHEYNNFASYFVVRMTILAGNRSATVDYIIHEGFCNDADGNESASGKLRDYCGFRNTVYNYTLTVNGISDIVTNVTTNDQHNDSMSGVIWEAENLPVSKDDYSLYGWVNVSANSNRIFRFYVGRGTDLLPLDYVSGSVTSDMDGMFWPKFEENNQSRVEDLDEYFACLRNGEGSQHIPISQFIQEANSQGGNFSFRIYPQSQANQKYPEAYRIGIYYYDPSETGSIDGYDNTDGCTKSQSKKCHVLEWMPAQKQKEQLYMVGNLPSVSNVVNFITQSVMLNFSGIYYRSYSESNVNRDDYQIFVKINENEYQVGSDNTCVIPISALNPGNNTYYAYAKAVNTNDFYDSGNTYSTISINTGSLNWDFSYYNQWDNTCFQNWYTSNFGAIDVNYMASSEIEKEWKDGLYVCLQAGKEMKFTTNTNNDRYLYFNNTGNGNGLKFTTYRNCKISVVVYSSSNGNERTLNISGADNSSFSWTEANNQNYTMESTITVESGSSKEISIYFSGGGAYIKSVTLSSD